MLQFSQVVGWARPLLIHLHHCHHRVIVFHLSSPIFATLAALCSLTILLTPLAPLIASKLLHRFLRATFSFSFSWEAFCFFAQAYPPLILYSYSMRGRRRILFSFQVLSFSQQYSLSFLFKSIFFSSS